MRIARIHDGKRAIFRSVACLAVGLGIALVFSACSQSPAAPSGTQDDIIFLGSNPAPGGTIPVTESNGTSTRAATLSFSVQTQTSGDLLLELELLDALGRVCAVGDALFSSSGAQATRVDVGYLGVGNTPDHPNTCPYPSTTATVETTTLKATVVGSRNPLFTKTLSVRYVFAGPGLSSTPTHPEVTDIGFGAARSGYPDIPGPNQDVLFWCQAEDSDGDALSVTLSLRSLTGACWTERHCWSETRTFGPRILDQTVRHTVRVTTPEEPILGRLTCAVEDAQGNRTTHSACFKMEGYPYGYHGAPQCP